MPAASVSPKITLTVATCSMCPPFFLLRGYPRERFRTGVGRPSSGEQVFDQPGARGNVLPRVPGIRLRVSLPRGRGQARGRRKEDERDRLLRVGTDRDGGRMVRHLSLIHISEPTRLGMISYAVFCL